MKILMIIILPIFLFCNQFSYDIGNDDDSINIDLSYRVDKYGYTTLGLTTLIDKQLVISILNKKYNTINNYIYIDNLYIEHKFNLNFIKNHNEKINIGFGVVIGNNNSYYILTTLITNLLNFKNINIVSKVSFSYTKKVDIVYNLYIEKTLN